jgi:hypothetical protein
VLAQPKLGIPAAIKEKIMARKKSWGLRPQNSSKMSEKRTDDDEFRFDIRARGGKITRLKFLERHGESFQPVEGDFTQKHVQHANLMAKAASALSKEVTLPFDAEAIADGLNAPRRGGKSSARKSGDLYQV